MKHLRLVNHSATKKGVASLYVVIFATILFGIITLSFARIILSEAEQSSNDDLFQSAYDSAMAGVEDAKYMVNQYYRCINQNGASSGTCEQYNIFTTKDPASNANLCLDNRNGFKLGDKMHHVDAGEEVKIQETSQNNSGNSSDQAYTCVLVTDTVPDYRGTLTTDTRVKVIPLSLKQPNGSSGTNLRDIARIQFSWYSQLNVGTKKDEFRLSTDSTLQNNSEKTLPPTVSLTLLTAGSNIDLDTFHSENNDLSQGYLYSQMLLLPSQDAPNDGNPTNRTAISKSAIAAAGDANTSNTSLPNSPFRVNCQTGTEFACVADLEIKQSDTDPGLFERAANAVLIVSLPYGDPFTDFAIKLFDHNGNTIELKGVQISVDSTGRTNQLYRRVETRLDAADLFFPYPQFSLELGAQSGNSDLIKNFWITHNCWYSQYPDGANSCPNNGNV